MQLLPILQQVSYLMMFWDFFMTITYMVLSQTVNFLALVVNYDYLLKNDGKR